MATRTVPPIWIRLFILIGALLFMFALVVSAVYDPSIRLLHTLQTLIYVAVLVLARRNSVWGFGAGCIIAMFWNYINLFVTTFIRNGIDQFAILFQTGQMPRPDIALGAVAGTAHFLLIVACLAGFLRTSPTARDWAKFLTAGLIAIAYFVVAIATTGPQYIGLLKKVFGL